ncbi:histamine H2 receptor-like [Strongylocentrotus purpuratus]|uniref:G-protein coupled receptors family 1 profile domain-containing protein n=1 Tax=Strongylocentrotus purpuratus TaxID=7668 RepID=A0A7M7G1H5_STRPU|nr:histamine H2 receptor-like [Strongylocentrotus purpuratus]
MNLSTESSDDESSQSSSIISTTVFIAFGLCGIIDNGLVLVVVGYSKDLRNATNLLIANQSLIDLMTSVFLLALNLAPGFLTVSQPVLINRFICGFWMTWYPFWMTVTASSVNLVVITFERFYAIAYPVRYRQGMNIKRVASLSVIPWVYGISFSIFFLFLTRIDGQVCLTYVWPNMKLKQVIGVLIFSIQFLGLICIISILYILIAVHLRRGLRGQTDAVNLRERARRNVLETLLIVFVCYIVCWAPNDIYVLNYSLKEHVQLEGILYDVTVLLAFSNAWINPIIYSFRYVKFQRAWKKMFCCRGTEKQDQSNVFSCNLANKNPNRVREAPTGRGSETEIK